MNVKPFLKWAGGKTQLLPTIDRYLPKDVGHLPFIEPFVGGGAMLFHMLTKYPEVRAVINDSNPALIKLYETIKHKPMELCDTLVDLSAKYDSSEDKKSLYLKVREMYNSKLLYPIQEGAYLIFLNKTCFNGLYRENKKGEFNVPFGHVDSPSIPSRNTLYNVSKALQRVEILCNDFSSIQVDEKSFIYLDSPYRPLNETSSFTKYVKTGFDDTDQRRLKEYFASLSDAGHYVMLSNSSCEDNFFQELYKDYHIHEVEAKRSINSKADKRGKVKELIITNY